MINATKKWIFLKISGAILVPLMIWFLLNFIPIYDQDYTIVVSFFKNPFISVGELNRLSSDFPEIPFYSTHDPDTVKIPAAWLLDNLGWKGKSLGDALVSANHALVIINQGGATGRQIYDLAKEMSLSVFNKYGITLVPEVKIIDP